MARQGLPVKRIYLSGPMTGLPGLNFAAFHAMTTNQTIDGVPRDDARHLRVLALHDVMQAVPSSSLYSLAEAVLDAGYTNAAHPQSEPVAVALPERLTPAELEELEVIEAFIHGQGLSNLAGTMAAARQFIDEVHRLNPSL